MSFLAAGGDAGAPRAVERWPYRFFVYSAAATLALGVEITYTRLVPKMPQLYAALIRAAVWDCIFVGVFVAQLVDLANVPFLKGIDSGHYLPCVVLLYHAIAFTFCGAYDLLTQQGSGRSRTLHRSLVCRRVLLELAGGKSGTKLFLGRICFIVSGAAMWLALHVLLLIDDDTTVLMLFIVLSFVAYSAAGLAALEPRRSLPGQLVQWLCTGWGSREALLQGPLKILGALLMLPFTASVIAAQVWLRTISFIVWLAVACPCCRLQIADNVFDAFEQELAVPLLQCSFLAFACTLGGMVLDSELSGMQRMAVSIVAAYYTAMLLMWTAPAVLQAKVAAEERASSWDEGSASQPLTVPEEGVELEELRSSCEELKALLQRERHDHAVELGQLIERLRDQERRRPGLPNSDQRLRHAAVQVDPMHWLQDAMVQVECGWPSQASQASHAAVQVDPVPVDPAGPGEDPEAQEPTEAMEATEAAEAAEATEATEAAEAAEATEAAEAAEAAPEPRPEDGEDGEDVTPGHSSQEPKQPADQEPAEFSHEAGVEDGDGPANDAPE